MNDVATIIDVDTTNNSQILQLLLPLVIPVYGLLFKKKYSTGVNPLAIPSNALTIVSSSSTEYIFGPILNSSNSGQTIQTTQISSYQTDPSMATLYSDGTYWQFVNRAFGWSATPPPPTSFVKKVIYLDYDSILETQTPPAGSPFTVG